MKKSNEEGVSPVVGVMLMLVVTIIIAAVVSASAGGTITGQKKVPQATITGKYSISNGLQIIHSGGDGLATYDTVFVVRNNQIFGQNVEQKSAQILNKTLITDSTGQFLDQGDGTSNVTSFMSGDVLYISAINSTCSFLQPGLASSSPNLCFSNSSSIGKTFSLEVTDTKGNLISKSDVMITP